MTDENKEEIKEVKQEPEAPKAPEAVQGAAETKAPAAAQVAEPVKAEEKKASANVKPAKEKPSNCAGCKKPIKNRLWYYRAGKYYCTKRCWSTTNKKPAKTEEAPAKT